MWAVHSRAETGKQLNNYGKALNDFHRQVRKASSRYEDERLKEATKKRRERDASALKLSEDVSITKCLSLFLCPHIAF